MSENTMNRKVGGSLGALLSLYGDSSGSESEAETNVGPEVLLPNPAYKGNNPTSSSENLIFTKDACDNKSTTRCVVKTEPDDTSYDDVSMGDLSVETGNGIVKTEPDDDLIANVKYEENPLQNDFASLRAEFVKVEGAEECQLDVQDFFSESDSCYNEAREIKGEVESGSSDSESDSSSAANESDYEEGGEEEDDVKKKREAPKVKGEFRLSDLPPIEDLHISVPRDECKPIGVIRSVVEPLVIVEAYPFTPALDLDSVLFLDKGDRALGRIFDVIGPVKQPMYCVRFNSKEHIEKNKVEVGMDVYCAPKTHHTTFVFLAQLRKLKGSDASWVNDIEPPNDEVEYSDDEMERFAKKKKRNRKKRGPVTEEDATYKEEGNNEQNSFRGRKRHFEQSGNSSAHFSRPPRPAFIPPMVPGFFPYDPRFYSHCQRFPPYNVFPHPRPGNHHRFRGGRTPNRFPFARPQIGHDGRSYENFGYCPPPVTPHSRPWCPPNEWQNSNYDFRAPNPFPAPQPAPPPPPPPGLS